MTVEITDHVRLPIHVGLWSL